MTSDRLFGQAASTADMAEAVSDAAWLESMLQVEAALAKVEGRLGLIPPEAAAAITASLPAANLDPEQIGQEAIGTGNPVIPMVRLLGTAVPSAAAGYLHWGATSQDILDTGMMLIARRALTLIARDTDAVAAAAADLAVRHRSTVMVARTLLQQAVPTTFGLKAAGWLTAVREARAGIQEIQHRGLALQFGGAAGTLAALGERGLDVSRELALELDLVEPLLPWHTARGRVLALATALGILTATVGKIALDVLLLAQNEVGEISEAGGGGSSTLPQKQNPVAAVEVLACVRGVNAQVALLMAAALQEHERAAGGWQAEWPAISELFRFSAGAVARTAGMLEGLQVNRERMAANLLQGGGRVMSECVMMTLAARIGRQRAHHLVGKAAAAAANSGRGFGAELKADSEISAQLGPADIDAALEPGSYLGSAEALVQRAVTAYQMELAAGK
ncbi:MAG: 3-carboxy-cis,cis-muconate cycloisomerase [Candidatus Dormibacteraeota bacterium]|nr:3-carboxy-cis,cis-muconate cycloisomerase [Candidatus Dormibacteraeota bacterium]